MVPFAVRATGKKGGNKSIQARPQPTDITTQADPCTETGHNRHGTNNVRDCEGRAK